MKEKFYTYILKSEKTQKFYIGSTKNIQKRLNKHNQGHSIATRGGIPWKLFYFEEFETRTSAIQREFEIKATKSKFYIVNLIK